VVATDPVEQPAALAQQPPESTDDNIGNKRKTLSKATLSKIIIITVLFRGISVVPKYQ
jgi:hypothetical protein